MRLAFLFFQEHPQRITGTDTAQKCSWITDARASMIRRHRLLSHVSVLKSKKGPRDR